MPNFGHGFELEKFQVLFFSFLLFVCTTWGMNAFEDRLSKSMHLIPICMIHHVRTTKTHKGH